MMNRNGRLQGSTAPLLGVVLAISAGCGSGDGLPRESVSGNVTLDGQPLESGLIQFEPTSPDVPTMTGGEIEDGYYSIPRAGGPVPGSYKVLITSSPKEAELDPEEGEMPGMVPMPKDVDSIPSQYNAQSTLTAEVKAGESNTFDFALER